MRCVVGDILKENEFCMEGIRREYMEQCRENKAAIVTAACSGQQRRIGAAGRRHMDEKVASRMPSGHRRTDGTGGSNLHTDRPSDGRAGSDFTVKQKNRHCAR